MLEGVNLHFLEENRANNQQKAKKFKNEWFTYQKMLEKLNHNRIKSLYDLDLAPFLLGRSKLTPPKRKLR